MTKVAGFWVKLTKPQRLGALIGIGVVTAVAVVLLGAYVVQASYANRVMPNTTVAGLDIGGEHTATASQILADQAKWLATTKIDLALNNAKQSMTATDLGVAVDTTNALQVILTPTDPLGWLKPHFWAEFFRHKTVPITFKQTDDQLQQLISQKFTVSATPKDASLSVVNGELTVSPDQPGQTIDISTFKRSISRFFATGETVAIALVPQHQSPAAITAAAASQTQGQIVAALHPVNLTANGKTTVIPVADQYGLIDYSVDGATLKWQISETKLTAYLQTTIGKKLNVKPVQQVIENNTNRMITQGVDGAAVDVTALEPSVLAAMTGTDPKPAAIAVPFKTVAFSTATVNPSYTLNLFQGVYLDVSLSQQKITIINTDTVVNQYGISSGGWKTPTPIGTFYIFNKIKEAYSPDFKLWMPDWNGLATSPDGTGYLGYGIHAVVCWDKACTNREGANHIGHPVSHGCIRVSDDGIGYIYDQVPIGTPVVIHT